MLNRASKLICGLCLSMLCAIAAAQTYPAKPMRLVVCFPSGSPSDQLGRLLGQHLADALGQPVVVDNRPGAGGVVGADTVAKATPDGYTLLLCGIGPLAISPGILSKIPYDTVRDFAPVSMVATITYVLVVSPALPANSVRELAALAKDKPGQLNYASAGIASASQLAMELFKNLTGTNIVHVPYKGTAPALADLFAGRVPMMIAGLAAFLPHVKAGRLKALGVGSATRSPMLPEVPTIEEAGVPGYRAAGWTGIAAPRHTPVTIVNRLSSEIARILKTPAVRDNIMSLGAEPVGSTPAEYGSFIREELAKWTRIIKALGIREE